MQAVIARCRAALIVFASALLLTAGGGARAASDPEPVTVFAAASLADALAEAAGLWQQNTGQRVTLVLAGSSAIARQVAAGAPADIVLSANTAWMDWLEERALVRADTRRVLLANRLVLVEHRPPDEGEHDAAVASDTQAMGIPDLTPESDLAGWLGEEGRLAMALVEAVPAGIYGRAALIELGLWEGVAGRVAQTDNVRAALALVALGEAPLGVVYATDAQAEPRVHVKARVPEAAHPPILYPAAITAESARAPEAARFLDWLAGPEAQVIFARHGFVAAAR